MGDKTTPLDTTLIVDLNRIYGRSIAVIDRDLTAPPGGEAEGDRYIVAAGGSGAWNGKDNQIAEYHLRVGDAAIGWHFFDPPDGYLCKVVDEALAVYYDHATTSWKVLGDFVTFDNLTIGQGAAGVDYTLTFNGETNDGVITWMEDEDYFAYSDDILMNTTERIYFRDTDISIHSSADGELDLTADVGFNFNTAADTDLVINLKGTTNSGLITWMEDEDYLKMGDDLLMDVAEKIHFRDTAIGAYSQADTFLDFFADGAVRIGDSSAGAPTNYANFGPDGELTLVGTARVLDQIAVNNANFGKGATAPDQVILGNYTGWEYEIDDDSVFSIHIPHQYEPGTDLTLKFDWYVDEAYATNSGEVNFQVVWDATPHDSTEPIDNPTHGATVTTGDINIPATAKYFTSNSVTISGTNIVADDQIGITLSRIALVGGNDPTAKPTIVDVHIEYTMNKLGIAT